MMGSEENSQQVWLQDGGVHVSKTEGSQLGAAHASSKFSPTPETVDSEPAWCLVSAALSCLRLTGRSE